MKGDDAGIAHEEFARELEACVPNGGRRDAGLEVLDSAFTSFLWGGLAKYF